MITKIAASLLTVAFFAACSSTQTASKRTTLRDMYASNSSTTSMANEPAPPAEGPEDVPAEGPRDPARNPALVPTPLIRVNAAGGL
ncbi:MAG: hypothetical protein QOJ87_463 [Verrucomicrobiota bacterium]|jgi:hypothetical protein